MSLSNATLPSALTQAGIVLPVERIDMLDAFLALIVKWNRAYNLTAVRDIDQMIPRHIIDSLSLLPHLHTSKNSNVEDDFDVIDIGSGAGLPVIPLAIVHPELRFLSIESNGKKTRFQQQAKLELGLQNVTVMQERAENVSAQASCVVSRAFTAPDKFLQIADRLCKPGGQVLIMLGKADKLPDTLPMPFTLQSVARVRIDEMDSERHIACVSKA